ncbi:MAG TPA: hypothetical protein PKN28_05835 [Clostridiales bacterium]|nr:hypothetical protein [Clostridiales bacterium]
MKGNKSTVKSVMIIMLALVLVSSVLVPMSANADTTGNYYTVNRGIRFQKSQRLMA